MPASPTYIDNSSRPSRRRFVQIATQGTAAAIAATTLSRSSLAEETTASETTKEASANEKLSIAVIGVGGRGQEHIKGFAGGKRTVVTHLCECDEEVGRKRCDQVAEMQGGRKPTLVRDIRTLLDDKSIDAVTIATPNHWHSLGSIWAVQAGKHVYVEKPVSHNVWEGRQLVLAAAKHPLVVQVGTQSRSNPGMKAAMKFIHEGGIGEVRIARGLCYKQRNSIGPKGDYPVPSSVDYDLWSGPAPMTPITRPRFHYDWHWQWNCGNGDLGNQGIHQMDLCRWALQKSTLCDRVFSYGGRFGYEDAGETANTQVIVHDYGRQQLVFEVRGLPTNDYREAKVGIIIEGTAGHLVMTSYDSGTAYDPDGKVLQKFKGGNDQYHFDNFVDAVLANDPKLANAKPEDGHLSSALCHLGNISMRLGTPVAAKEMNDYCKDVKNAPMKNSDEVQSTLGRTLEHLTANQVDIEKTSVLVGPTLDFNPTTETFKNNEQANAMLSREYRKGYEIKV